MKERDGGYQSGYEGYGNNSSYQNTASSEDNLQYQAVYNYINGRQYQQALNVLSRMQNRNAQWYYLSACANMGLGNNVNALNLARQAQSMDPGNPEYANLVNRLQWNSNRYQGGSYYGAEPEVLPAEPEICAATCGVQILFVSAWEGIFVHACKYQKTCCVRASYGFRRGTDHIKRHY